MLRSLCRVTAYNSLVTSALRAVPKDASLQVFKTQPKVNTILNGNNLFRQYSTGLKQWTPLSLKGVSGFQAGLSNTNSLVMPGLSSLLPSASPSFAAVPSRSVTKWSIMKGKRKSAKSVIKRFKRLPWGVRGIWIRGRAGAQKRIWKKSRSQRFRCKTHVFCNAAQSRLFDKMVTKFWRKMRHYPDDPYGPYLTRENFRMTQGYPREFY